MYAIFVSLFLLSCCAFAEQKLKVGPNNVIDGWGAVLGASGQPATNLLDEQDVAGDPASGKGGKPKNPYFPGWSPSWYYPAAFALIDLQVEYSLSSLWVYHDLGTAQVEFSIGPTPFQFIKSWNTTLGYSEWKGFNFTDATVRWIQVKLYSVSPIMEVVLYGTPQGTPPSPPTPKEHPLPLLKNFLGTNVFVDDDPQKLAALGVVREYQDWGWTEGNGAPSYKGYPNNQNEFEPAYSGFHIDRFYRQVKELGVDVHQCMQSCAPYLHNNTANTDSWKPITLDLLKIPNAATDPRNYAAHGDHAFQIAARYGRTVVPTNLLKLAPNQNRTTGADLLRYIEFWNEQNAWWHGREAYFSPYEYSAMLSTDYDGHESKVGKTIGVKNADRTMKVVMGGLASLSFDYVKTIKIWAEYNRVDKNFPADVINLHHYSNNAGDQGGAATTGISPEDDNLKNKLLEWKLWRNTWLPDRELWLSEFGYDTNAASPQKAPSIGQTPAEIVQGQWIIRSYLAIAAAGFDRAHQYMLRDVQDNSLYLYATSGLTSSKDSGWKPKPSWYFVYTMKNRLGEMSYVRDSTDPAKNVTVAKFEVPPSNRHQAVGPTQAYVIWCPTSTGHTVSGYSVQLDGSPTSATQVTLAVGSTMGSETILTVSSSHISVDVSETPIFVLV